MRAALAVVLTAVGIMCGPTLVHHMACRGVDATDISFADAYTLTSQGYVGIPTSDPQRLYPPSCL